MAASDGESDRGLSYLLLVGDGTYDPRNYLGFGANDLVPVKLVDTAVAETASDDWFADFDGDGLSEMAVGRLPAGTAAEASAMVAKISPGRVEAQDRGGTRLGRQ